MTDAFPLQWPAARPRTRSPASSRFRISMHNATQNLIDEVRRMGGSMLIISTNVELRRDGLPYANQRSPADTGVAVYFTHKGRQMCFACDRWNQVGDNIYAIAKSIDALRGIERWGSGSMIEQAFTGFMLLAAPKDPLEILGLRPGCSPEDVKQAYIAKAKLYHPDTNSGSTVLMAELNEAMDRIRKANPYG